MAIYRVGADGLELVPPTSFEAEGLHERRDIQARLRENIEVLGERLMVVSEEFCDWLDSSRRIDLLCLDPDANLVVVELKRTEDGGHMELQALRYAAMVSKMTFDQLVETHARFLDRASPSIDTARGRILEFLDWDQPRESDFAQDVRIVLCASDFGKELTTAVMWLREYDVDIRCVRLKLHRGPDGGLLVDIQQLIPLPEAAAFQTQLGIKKQSERHVQSERHELRLKFWSALIQDCKAANTIHANRSPTKDNWLAGGTGRTGFPLNYVVREDSAQVELWIGMGAGQRERNKRAFQLLHAQKEAIEREFGEPLTWDELPDRDGARVSYQLAGGYRSPEDDMPRLRAGLIDAMCRLEQAVRSRVLALDV